MTDNNQHSEWLSLLDVSGPFLAEPVLENAFPQGLEQLNPNSKKSVRQAYDEWRDSITEGEPDAQEIHVAWISHILSKILELDEDGSADVLKKADTLSDTLAHEVPGHSVTLRPSYAVIDDQDNNAPKMLIVTYAANVNLDNVINSDGWLASPEERIVELCRSTNVRLGLLTNGEQWMLIDAPVGGITTFASWYARLWIQEPKTLQAFVNLLGIRRFFVSTEQQLPALLDKSLEHQDDVTDALGEQVRRAVEVLIQSFDRADIDRNRTLLTGIKPSELYEAGLTVMMRIVFLLSAEERGLMLLGDEHYETNYAISTLRSQLRKSSTEILDRRWDAWSRLLALFRAVYAGVDHQTMRLPALGGSLFDPDRFPFLEGRPKGSKWKEDRALPLPIDNRTVLLLLDAVQLFRGRTLSYRALDVEQIGYVYEGLLERTAIRAKDVTLDLNATKSAKTPWVLLAEIEKAVTEGAVDKLLKERTKSSPSRIKNDLAKTPDDDALDRLLVACQNDEALRDKLKPYIHFIRLDSWGYPLVYPKDAFMIAAGMDRRESGTHYTPKSLTEQIVQTTLTPLAYAGPSEGLPEDQWSLKSPSELLELRICDPAMGSGAFLVQVCRWLSDRLIESWANAEKTGGIIAVDGSVINQNEDKEHAPEALDERLVLAKRLIAEKCLYGVDMNPLAVELAKLSIWLVTLAKGRPFGFLDHNLKSGDSLLGITDLDQLNNLDMIEPQKASRKLFAHNVNDTVANAIELRKAIRARPVNDIHDVEVMKSLDQQARTLLKIPTIIADSLVGETLASKAAKPDTTSLSIFVGQVLGGDERSISELTRRGIQKINAGLAKGQTQRRPFHWPLEFPEVFTGEKSGFDGIIGNPPFIGNKFWKERLGTDYQRLAKIILGSVPGKIDLCVLFHRHMACMLNTNGAYGLMAADNIAEGSAISVGLGVLVKKGDIFAAVKGLPWPGKAAVEVSIVHYWNGSFTGKKHANGVECEEIGPRLTAAGSDDWEPKKLDNILFSFAGVDNSKGLAFVITKEHPWFDRLKNEANSLLVPYITGDDITTYALNSINRWALDIADRELSDVQAHWPLAFQFINEEVLPTRTEKALKSYKGLVDRWWQFWNHRADLMRKLRTQPEFIGYCKVTKYPICMLCPSDWVYTNKVILIEQTKPDTFAICLSSFFRLWLEKYSGGRLEGRLSLSISESIAKFPLPNLECEESGIAAATQFNVLSIEWCRNKSCGLTEIMNSINDPENCDPEIKILKSLLTDIDTAVSAAYGWSDLNFEYDYVEKDSKVERDKLRWECSMETQLETMRRLIALNKEQCQPALKQLNLEVG